MSISTILKKGSEKQDIIAVPRAEYEDFLKFKKIKTFIPTIQDKKVLKRAMENLKKGKSISFDEFTKKSGIKD